LRKGHCARAVTQTLVCKGITRESGSVSHCAKEGCARAVGTGEMRGGHCVGALTQGPLREDCFAEAGYARSIRSSEVLHAEAGRARSFTRRRSCEVTGGPLRGGRSGEVLESREVLHAEAGRARSSGRARFFTRRSVTQRRVMRADAWGRPVKS